MQITSDQTKSKNPRPTGRGGTVADGGWGNILSWKREEIDEFSVAPYPAYSATFSLMEKAKIFGTTINSIDKFSSSESIY